MGKLYIGYELLVCDILDLVKSPILLIGLISPISKAVSKTPPSGINFQKFRHMTFILTDKKPFWYLIWQQMGLKQRKVREKIYIHWATQLVSLRSNHLSQSLLFLFMN